jgi:hypothetical protein
MSTEQHFLTQISIIIWKGTYFSILGGLLLAYLSDDKYIFFLGFILAPLIWWAYQFFLLIYKVLDTILHTLNNNLENKND